jgi:methionyl-tRNA synthetase
MTIFDTKTFLTTTLPYVNSSPHIGHAFEFILADAISRYLKTKSDVHFNIGLDEHGLKVWSKSQELGLTPEQHIQNLTTIWLDFCQKFQIKYDSFYKTSDKSHHDKVKILWNRFLERGDIYKKSYTGKYCLGCEAFKLDKELTDGKCQDHPTTELQNIQEENYFFRLTKYRGNLLNWLNTNPDFLQPSTKLEELKNIVINCDDISISRLKTNCPWGVDVPNDPNQIIYVWFDALLNYIFAAGYLTDDFNWSNVIQLCGPDNLRFQGLIFQAFLESEGIKKTDKLLVHGTILDKSGRKISKTLGNTIDPFEQLEKWGLDAVRYYSLVGLSTYSNSNWNEEDLKIIYNNDICSGWGNLLTRTLHLIDSKSVNIVSPTNEFQTIVDNQSILIDSLWSEFRIKEALQKTTELVKIGNKYINDETPWSNSNFNQILSNLYYLVSIVNKFYEPVFPDKYLLTEEAIKNKKKIILFEKIK